MPTTLQGDYSQMYQAPPQADSNMAAFQSNWIGQFLSGTYERDLMDFNRSEQAANNAFVRDMMKLDEQNAFNASEAQKNRDWQTEMSNTAYQRAMADMKAAGLNPVLAYSQGGASTPSGSSASSGSGNASQGRAPTSSSGQMQSAASIIKGIVGIVSGLYGVGAEAVTSAVSLLSAGSKKKDDEDDTSHILNWLKNN